MPIWFLELDAQLQGVLLASGVGGIGWVLNQIVEIFRHKRDTKHELAVFRDEMIRIELQSVDDMLDRVAAHLAVVRLIATTLSMDMPMEDKDKNALLEGFEELGELMGMALVSVQSTESVVLHTSFQAFSLVFSQMQPLLLEGQWEECVEKTFLIQKGMSVVKRAIRIYRYDVRSGAYLLEKLTLP